MGITYKALDSNLGCAVALKVINTDRLVGDGARDRFIREARTAAQLRHANIASVFHLGLDEENCFYAMEHIEGETLELYISRLGRIPVKESLNIVLQCAKALRFAHERKSIHRDIKPSNIMLTVGEHGSEGERLVKVIDFGLVTIVAGDEMSDAYSRSYFAGTPFYASPEQLRGDRIDERTDIYSLGVCLWHMLTGDCPAQRVSSSTREMVSLHQRFRPLDDHSTGVPPSVIELAKSMTSADPTQRPVSATALMRRVEQCVAEIEDAELNENPLKGSVQPSQSGSHGAARHRLSAWALLSVSVVALVCGLLWLTERSAAAKSTLSAEELEGRVLYEESVEHLRKNTKPDNQLAIEQLTKLTASQPSFADAHAVLSKALFQSVARFGAPVSIIDQALASARRAIASGPSSPQGYVSLAAIQSWQGKHWEALSQLHRALELDPKSVRAMHDFGLLWSIVGHPELGLPWSRAAAEIDPTNPWGWIMAADACIDLCNDSQAAVYYQRCLEINPMFVEAHCGLLHIHLLAGDFAAAKREYALVESIEEGLILPQTLKAQIDLFSGDYEQAEKSYRQLLARDRGGAVNYYSGISYLSALAYLRARSGDIAESSALLDEASKMHVSDTEGPQAIYDLAAIRSVQGHEDDALSLLRRAVAAGWMDIRATRLDPRFERLREKPQFVTILADLDAHVSKMQAVAKSLCVKPLTIVDYPARTALP